LFITWHAKFKGFNQGRIIVKNNNAVLFKSILSYRANVGCYAQHSHLSIIRIVKDQSQLTFQLLVYFKEIKLNHRLFL
jgi:hypothetical protein